MKALRRLAWICVLLFATNSDAQVRRQTPAPDKAGDYGTKFFDDLKILFGRLQQSELQLAFRRANSVQCADLVGEKGMWKQVAFLNDDRSLGDWHFDSIDQVKEDLAEFVFSGSCRGEQGPVKLTTAFPVTESLQKFQNGRIPFSQVIISDNDPVSAVFESSSGVYTFQLPYLYPERKDGVGGLFTLFPPLESSQPDRKVALEFRCKAMNDPDLTYRFMLCRTRTVERDAQLQKQAEGQQQPLGNAAYYILSDGKEATSSVKLDFGKGAETPPPPPPEKKPIPEAETEKTDSTSLPNLKGERVWKPADPKARLVEISQDPFRLHFDPRAWSGRIGQTELLMGQSISDFGAAKPDRNKEYCLWKPDSPNQVSRLLEKADDSVIYSLAFRKDLQSVSSATFEVEGYPGGQLGTLQCFFPQNDNPASITVEKWKSIVGDRLIIEVQPK